MRRILSFLAAVCLLFLCAAAMAESTATQNLVETEDFTLTLDPGAQIDQKDPGINQVNYIIYPYAGSGDTATNITIAKGTPFVVNAAVVKAMLPQLESSIKEQYAAQGITANALSFNEPSDTTLDGKDCVYYQMEGDLNYLSLTIPVYQGIYQIGSYSYSFSLTATSKETLVTLIQMLNNNLKWK